MTPRANPAPAPAVEKSPTPAPASQVVTSLNTLSRLERAALAHKNAVAEKRRLEAEVEEANRKWESAQQALHEASLAVIDTSKELTAAALGKPE